MFTYTRVVDTHKISYVHTKRTLRPLCHTYTHTRLLSDIHTHTHKTSVGKKLRAVIMQISFGVCATQLDSEQTIFRYLEKKETYCIENEISQKYIFVCVSMCVCVFCIQRLQHAHSLIFINGPRLSSTNVNIFIYIFFAYIANKRARTSSSRMGCASLIFRA